MWRPPSPSSRLEIDGDAEGRALFVDAAVTLADGTRFVVGDFHQGLQRFLHFACFGHQLGFVLEQRENARLDRRDARMEPQDDARLLLPFSSFTVSSS